MDVTNSNERLRKFLPFFSGETVITDHVRSIVRECLQEADVNWTSSYQPDINDNHMYDTTGIDDVEQPLEENADNLVFIK